MRIASLVLVLGVLGGHAATARAEDTDPDYAPFPGRSIAIGVQGHGTRIGGRSEGGFGPMLEAAIGRGRWQYFGEAAVATAGLEQWTTPAADTRIDGRVARGGLGLRWLARQFAPGSGGGVELVLTSQVGAQRFYFADGGRLTRPEVALGFGIQGRGYRRPRLAFRLDVRLLFTPNGRESALVACSRTCMAEAGASTGFLTGMALSW